MNEWKFAQKRSVVVQFREPEGHVKILGPPYTIVEGEWTDTLEGRLLAVKGKHYIIRGVAGELYPCDIKIFNQTYDVLPDWMQKWRLNEAKWKNDLVGIVWAYARSSGLLILDTARTDAGRERLPPGLGDLMREIRWRCDRCGITPRHAQIAENSFSRMNPITDYQCCHVHRGVEDYTPKLCPTCHSELEKIFPHSIVSV